MCGIMGYIGEENATDIVISGLENLEYRGYDSAGLAVWSDDGIRVVKTVGSPSGLRAKSDNLSGKTGIGHTRWATHGAATLENAHPHISNSGLFAVVHNGIIENYLPLKSKLEESGYSFKSSTDTEVIAQLLEANYDGDLKGTFSKTVTMLKGSFALSVLCRDYPDVIICAKVSSPLFVGTAQGCGYIASDVSALSCKSERIYRLNDGEIGFLKRDGFKVFDTDGCRIRKSEVKLKSVSDSSDKGEFEHYMLKEIYEQPIAVRRTLSEILTDKKIQFKSIKLKKQDIINIGNVLFIACGSAYHAGVVGAYATEQLFHRSSQACIASEFRYKHPHIDSNTLAVIISQSGETADTLAALRIAKEKGAKVVSVVNVENSTIAQESDCVIPTRAGKEVAVATTKAYSAQLAVIYTLVVYLSVISGEISKRQGGEIITQLKSIPEKIEEILAHSSYISELANKACRADYICFIGRGYDYCTALESSLKLKEISYIACEAYAAGELKHGTISLIDNNSLVVALCCSKELRDKMMSNVSEVIARGADVISVTDYANNGTVTVPDTLDILAPMLEVVPMQLFAYYTALKLGCAIDKPRNLAKSVTVE